MKKYGIVAILAGLIVGCGGAGDTSHLSSLYQGSWSGTWNSSDANDGGAITLVVTADGSFTGSIANKFASGTFGGQINKAGGLTGVGSFTSGGNMIVGGAVTMSSGRISSNFSYLVNGIQYGGSFDCGAAGGSTGTTSGGG
ncbi:MAG: hypothetical protein WCI55_00615 [Armatimonadota bacterium]